MSHDFIFFDLEGPLSPQDNAYDLMRLFPEGGRVFEIVSRYDDLLTLEEKAGYEPGDTLALIVPFLVLHDIPEDAIVARADAATLIGGAAELVGTLKSRGWKVFCITTTYEQYARRVTKRVGIAPQNIACTPFPLDRMRRELCKAEAQLLQQAQKDILALDPSDDAAIKRRLDRLYWEQLPETAVGKLVQQVKPVGGRRKVAALDAFAGRHGQPLPDCVAVGDSITDFRMLRAVDSAGGLAIAFNANEYALPCATLGLASTHLSDLLPVLETWQSGTRSDVQMTVARKETAGSTADRDNWYWLSGRDDTADALKVHKRMRRLVREEAGKLG